MGTNLTRPPRLARRWLAALALAAAVAMWPACSQEELGGDGPAGTPAKMGFVLKDLQGQDVRLEDFKGHPLLLNFWATWCGPCRAEMPGFVNLVEKYKREGLMVVGVSIDDSAEELRQFAAAHPVNYPLLVGLGHDDLIETYGARYSVPVSWLIRRDGTVFMKKVGTDTPEWFESQVKALF